MKLNKWSALAFQFCTVLLNWKCCCLAFSAVTLSVSVFFIFLRDAGLKIQYTRYRISSVKVICWSLCICQINGLISSPTFIYFNLAVSALSQGGVWSASVTGFYHTLPALICHLCFISPHVWQGCVLGSSWKQSWNYSYRGGNIPLVRFW